MATALVTQIAYAVQTLFDPAGTAGRLVDLGKLANYGLLTSFTPAYLFTTGVNGAWYDPSDFSTMFQDAAGTTPVTAVGQPVGLMLDKSKGLVLGPELVTNGDLSNGATGWVTANGGAIVNSRCECTTASNFLSTTAAILTVGKWYSAEFDYFMTAGAKLRVATKDTVGPDAATIVATSQSLVTNAVTRLKIKFQAAVGGFFILQASDATFSGWVDNISVRELPGNHAFNPSGNSANFPVLSARYNLLTKTEQFDDAVWVKVGSSTASNASTLNFPNPNEAILQTALTTATVGTSATFSVELSGSGTIYIGCYRSAGGAYEEDKLKVTLTSTPTRYYVSHTMANAGQTGFGGYISRSTDGTATTVTASKAQLIHTNDALNQPAYQRVNTATDYDTVGFKPYLSFNGVNQWLQTNSIDFTYGDKMFVSAVVRKLSDAARAILFEFGLVGTSSGSFNLNAPEPPYEYDFSSQGTSNAIALLDNSTYTAPITNVLSGIGNISGAQSILRVNGAQAAISTADQGTGNYGNYPLYIGARAGTSLWFNGRLYGMVVAGKQASAAEITSTETYINQRTGAF